jgi:hypothetical protein
MIEKDRIESIKAGVDLVALVKAKVSISKETARAILDYVPSTMTNIHPLA